MLREARTALSNHQYDQAESIAQEVKGWNLSFGLFEDNPDKVAAAARALRKRDKIRTTTPREQASQGVYDVLVQESRQLVKIGKLDEAEVKVRQAQRMNVIPALTADRAESVLHDIAMARAGPALEYPPPPRVPRRPASWPSARPTTFWPRVTRPGPPPSSPKLRSSGSRNPVRVSTPRPRPHRRRSMRPSRRAQANRPVHRCWRPQARRARSPPTSPRQPPLTSPRPSPPVLQLDNPAAEPASPAPDNPALDLAPADPPKADAPTVLAPAALPKRRAAAPPDLDDQPRAAAPAAGPDVEPQVPAAAGTPPASKGQQILAEAKTLYTSGNYPAARQLAEEAKAGRHGVDSQADELLAQIGLAEQGGALSLYESALSAMRNGENARLAPS